MADSSPYTVKTLYLYLKDLERRKQTARDIADPDEEDHLEDPGWIWGRRVAESERILRSWSDVERFLTKCEAAGFAFDAAGVNRWLAIVCDTHGKRPSEVADWSLSQFCDLAGSNSEASRTVARVGEAADVEDVSGGEAMRRLLSVFTGGMADEKFQRAAAILQDGNLSANDKLTKIDAAIPLPATASTQDLGDLIGVTKQCIAQTEWWKEHRKGEKADEVGRRRDVHTQRAKQYEEYEGNPLDDVYGSQ